MIRVFIQNEAGSDQKHMYDEKTLEYQRTVTVARAYPFPYGFILGTTAGDGCNLDCYVISRKSLKTGTIVECEPVALLEQMQNGEADHNVLAVLPGEGQEITETIEDTLREFIAGVFENYPNEQVSTGKLLAKQAAEAHIAALRDHCLVAKM